MGYLTGAPRTADVVAKTQCLVSVIKKEDFLNLVQSKPRLAEELLQTLSRRIAEGNSKIITNTNTRSRSTNKSIVSVKRLTC